ncbi:MAG: GLPGLI family protein [Flavobacteriaceae bacterium]|nr:GLPGLI family protein [Bacteroidia bacterium]MBT8286375.1 GLPGLI family protein [Bacteroidia bacterium]NNF76085.1 GLPGLI family protein [Flavobacteriaceae bacterium]
MKSILLKLSFLTFAFLLTSSFSVKDNVDEFQGKAYYFSKSRMNLGNWGARLSEAQKKQIEARMKNRLEKTYVLLFNKEESVFEEESKLDAISGATDSWGKNFSPGEQYKNVKTNTQIQNQEFYGKRFLVKDELQPIEWMMGTETKQIGNYICFKATASIPTSDLTWYSFSWDRLRNNNQQNGDPAQGEEKETEPDVAMTEVEAWYTLQLPVRHGPLEYWGLPGLILEVSAGDTTILCSKIVMNPDDKTEIEAPEKGKVVSKKEYQNIIAEKMREFRDNRGGRRR